MAATSESSTTKTPAKKPRHPRSQTSETRRMSENLDPNLPIATTPQKQTISSPAIPKSVKSNKSVSRNPCRPVAPPHPPPPVVRERKFIIARKKNGDKGDRNRDPESRRQAAYEALRTSQEGFFHKDRVVSTTVPNVELSLAEADGSKKEQEEKEQGNATSRVTSEEPLGVCDLEGSSKVRKIRSMMLEEAMNSIPESGSGRVMHLVKAFESLLSITKAGEGDKAAAESKRKVMNWALPGLHNLPKPKVAPSSVCSSTEFSFPPKDFDRDSNGLFYSSVDSGDWSSKLSCDSRTSSGSRRSRRNSSDSSGRNWNRKLRVTSQHPFKLRTEQRGRLKEENFLKKVKEIIMEEEKLRIPIAQGLPWTTDEPECLVKPPVKETTEPIDLILHSDVRAVERAEFDQYVAERLTIAEQMKLERERQQRLEEVEEIRRLRKALVPRAQPMPYFDRPFAPKKSTRPRTVPKEPRFHMLRPHKTCEEAAAAYREIAKYRAS